MRGVSAELLRLRVRELIRAHIGATFGTPTWLRSVKYAPSSASRLLRLSEPVFAALGAKVIARRAMPDAAIPNIKK